MSENWKQVAADARTKRLASIPSEWLLQSSVTDPITVQANLDLTEIPRTCGILSKKEIDITENYTATALLEKLKLKTFSSEEVTTAFCKRAAIAHQLVNCCTSLFFDVALKRARECDEHLARTGKTLGPLHGLPISIKDLFHIPDVQTTSGYILHAADAPQTAAAGITEALFSLGAVFYVKTNMSQMGFAFDSDNNLFGRTLNPLHTGLTPGGSSGGESALIALRGSVLGVGTDALGSLRTPAHATGTFAMKPTSYRVPFGGMSFRTAGTPGNPIHVGPVGTSVEDLGLFLKSVIQSKPWEKDVSLAYNPWADTVLSVKTLNIGFLTEDKSLPLYPPMRRAMQDAQQSLTTAGHSLIHLKPGENFPELLPTAMLTLQFATMDPYSPSFKKVLEAGEPFVPSVAMSLPPQEARESMKPNFEKFITASAQRQTIAEMVHKIWEDNSLDAVVMPLHNTVAPPVDSWNTGSYLALWNLLPYPVINIPYGSAKKEKDAAFILAEPDTVKYDHESIEGMPCSLQIVGKPFRDEILLEVASRVERDLKLHD